jgi:putative endonuclease
MKTRDAAVAAHLELGRFGEQIAADFLRNQGYRIVAMNFITRLGRNHQTNRPLSGEIDIIAYEGALLCFIEVKTRRSAEFALPEEAVDNDKQQQLRRTAARYQRLYGVAGAPVRFDVVAVILPARGRATIRLTRGFFPAAGQGR